VTQLSEGLALWRGPVLADVMASPTVEAQTARLELLRLSAIEDYVSARLDLGRHREVVDELAGLVREHPWRERLWAQRMLALYRCGRRVEALDAYRQGHALLTREYGIEPGPDLRTLQRAILTDDVPDR
jgi:DNA-binding SARP family transcriptional activator